MDWRAALIAAGPLYALLAQEKETGAGAAAGATVEFVSATVGVSGAGVGIDETGAAVGATAGGAAGAGVRTGDEAGVRADDTMFDNDIEAVMASLAAWMFQQVTALRFELETRDGSSAGSLPVRDFAAAVAAAGYGTDVFGPTEVRWALTACHHQTLEGVVVYPKYLAMVLAGIEREVYRPNPKP
jgi:hypothetical protein